MSLKKIRHDIRTKRIELGISQARLAALSGTHQQHISLIESGRIKPNLATLDRILSALGQKWELSSIPDDPARRQDRLSAFARFNAWEQASRQERDPAAAWDLAGAWAGTYLRLHGPGREEPWEAKAAAWRAWRKRLARCRP